MARELVRGGGGDAVGVLAGVALGAQAFDAAVFLAAGWLDEALAVGGVVEHEARVGDLGGHGGFTGDGTDDLVADEGQEQSEHGCGAKVSREDKAVNDAMPASENKRSRCIFDLLQQNHKNYN
jgi:hypothetical protein